jgi:hypothetical protein
LSIISILHRICTEHEEGKATQYISAVQIIVELYCVLVIGGFTNSAALSSGELFSEPIIDAYNFMKTAPKRKIWTSVYMPIRIKIANRYK